MMRREWTEAELMSALSAGWMVAWFAMEDSDDDEPVKELLVDLCCNWRLHDAKAHFLRVPVDGIANVEGLLCELGDPSQWSRALAEYRTQCFNELRGTK